MLHSSRRKYEKHLSDCIHSAAGAAVPLSDNITLGEISASDIQKVVKLNTRLKELKLPFYAVCGRGGQPSFRRVGDSCVDEKNIAYISPTIIDKRLQRQYGFSLHAVTAEDLSTLRKKIEEKTAEGKKTTITQKKETGTAVARTERLRAKRTRTKKEDDCTSCKETDKKKAPSDIDAKLEKLEKLLAASRKTA